jgi:DNA-binding response OmpR family regulator
MPRRHHVVIVAQNPALATALLSWLGSAGYELAIVTTFAAAKALLETEPALIVSELKLGAYNGLHLALKARAAGIPAIVIGPSDPVLAKDAEELGASYLTSVLRRRHVLDLVAERLGPTGSHVTPTPLSADADLMWHFEQDRAIPEHPGSQGRRLLH